MPVDPSQPSLPEEVVRLDDPRSGLEGLIVIHSTRLGPAAGGCRLWHYDNRQEAERDAMRLAEGMSYKNALARLPLGGGKAVIRRPAGDFDRGALFRAFGHAVASLDGRYVTAEDVGTSVADMEAVADETGHVAGLPARREAPGGDPSPWTALGVFRAMEVAVRRRLGAELADVTVGLQGLGNVGYGLCGLLHRAGAKLVVAEPRAEAAARAAEAFGATVMGSEALLTADLDVFAPCALGGVLDAATVAKLRAMVVCGGANNQLETATEGEVLADRGILYAPDYVVNAGGIINVAAEYLNWGTAEVEARVGEIGARLGQVFDLAERDGTTPGQAADRLARTIIAGHRKADACAA